VLIDQEYSEVERVAAVRALRLLDTPVEDRFDRIAEVARQLFDVPIALVTLVDLDRQWTKACAGHVMHDIPRDESFCSVAVATGKMLVVPDAATDPHFANLPTVRGEPHIRFYAGQPVAAPSGHLVGTLCVLDRVPRRLSDRQRGLLSDLAAWVELEYTVLHANQWEQQAERARRDFVSVVGHELRTPLTSIRGSLELIGSGRFGVLPAQVDRLVRIATRSTDRLVRLADDVVDVHQMQRGQLNLRLDGVTLTEIVEQAVLAVEDVAARAAVRVEVRCSRQVHLQGDADRLVQVITNLLVNAIHVSPRDQPVTVTCGANGSRAEIAVRDHGPGILQGQLDEIFEPFVQFDSPGRTRIGGAGLGLAIARGIVEAHGGYIHARLAPDEGSIFEVSLPSGGPQQTRPWW
jgi:signal transduction histidine kinase